MKLQNKAVLIRVPQELVDIMQLDTAHYTTKMTEILMAHYNLTLVQVKQMREAANND